MIGSFDNTSNPPFYFNDAATLGQLMTLVVVLAIVLAIVMVIVIVIVITHKFMYIYIYIHIYIYLHRDGSLTEWASRFVAVPPFTPSFSRSMDCVLGRGKDQGLNKKGRSANHLSCKWYSWYNWYNWYS